MFRWIPLALLLAVGPGSLAQPGIVPAEHAVYAWLADQRVAGRLPGFRPETLPTDRAAVRRHLDSLAVRADRLGPSDRGWLRAFRDEFAEPAARVHSDLGDDVRLWTPPEDGSKAFLSGHRFAGLGLKVLTESEPARGIALRLLVDVQFWDRRETDGFVWIGPIVRP